MNEDGEFIPTRQTLLSRLKDLNNEESWKEFFDTYWRFIYSAAVKSGLSDDEAQEVVQETVISVAKNMPRFQYDPTVGSFKSWLLKLTRWRVVDQVRKRQARVAVLEGPPELVEEIPDPAAGSFEPFWEEEWTKNVFEAAIQRARARVHPKHYQVFDLYVRKEQPAAEVAKVFGLNVAQVYLIKCRVSHVIRNEVRKIEKGLGH
jgi:RNA polymerase sigma-70 factor (ECF subfamily)